jgi:hypothetical protein
MTDTASSRLRWIALIGGLTLWFAAAVVLAVDGRLAGPLLPLFTFGPPVAAVIAYRVSPRVRGFVGRLDLRGLVALHATRTVGIGFVLLWAYGVLPGVFAWPAGVGDAVAAMTAVGIVLWWLGGGSVSRRTLVWWNTFGLADFLTAVAVGTLARSTALGGAANADAMASLPLVLFPAFVVPLFALTHLAVLVKVRRLPRGEWVR